MKRNLLLLLIVWFVVAGSGCSIFEGFLIAVDIRGLTGEWPINPGSNPNYSEFTIVRAADYLDPDFSDNVKDVLIYDMLVWVTGTYGGNVNGIVNANGQPVLAYAGPWDTFLQKQSLVQALLGNNPYITPQPNAISILVNAVLAKQDITLQSTGSVSQTPVPDDLVVYGEVLGQVRAEPD
jgi:hypothetical protein